MVQELHVLRCFSCDTFQSHIVKKTSKWECKICGVKQSIKKVYGTGSGKDCRIHTQKLNALKGQKEEIESYSQQGKEINEQEHEGMSILINEPVSSPQNPSKRTSKWAEFIDENESAVYQNHCTKLENITFSPPKTLINKVQKRKIKDMLEYKKITSYSHGFDPIESNCSVFSNSGSPRCTKKIKFNKHHLSENNSYNRNSSNNSADRDNSTTQEISRKPMTNTYYKSNFKNQGKSKSDTKWTAYLECEKETNMPENSSLKNNIHQTGTNVSLKWRKYVDEEEGVTSPVTPSPNTIIKHQSESKIGIKLMGSFKNCPQEESVMSCFQNSEHFKKESSDESFTVSRRQEEQLNSKMGPDLPIFEYNCEISDSVFELDF